MRRLAKSLAAFVIAWGAVVTSSCSTTGSGAGEASAPAERAIAAASACLCGSERGLLYGCDCRACASGAGNPDVPECLCATIPPDAERYLHLRSGRAYKGTPLRVDGDSVVIESAGGVERTFALAELEVATAYPLLRARVAEDDFDGQVSLAGYALANAHPGCARRHWRLAARADPSRLAEVERGMARLRRQVSGSALRQARRAFAAGDQDRAREWLLDLLWPFAGEAAATSARNLFTKLLEAWIARSAEPEPEAGRPAWVARRLEPARRHLESALREELAGVEEYLRPEEAARHFEEALQAAIRAYELVTHVEQVTANRAALEAAALELKGEVERAGVECHLHLAFGELAAGATGRALDSLGRALAIDPAQPRALELLRFLTGGEEAQPAPPGWYPTGAPVWMWPGPAEGPTPADG